MRAPRALALSIVLSLAALPLLAAGASVQDLAWMTGTWKGALGPGTLEETWATPDGGVMAALVRGTSNGKNNMVELIVIEEENDSLVLRLQQWNPGFDPRTEGPQSFALKESTDRKVVFEATSEGSLKTLGYSRPADDEFVISITTAGGQSFDIPLKAQ